MGPWLGMGGCTLITTNHLVDKHEDYEWYRTYMDEKWQGVMISFSTLG